MRQCNQTIERGWNLEDWGVKGTSKHILPRELKKRSNSKGYKARPPLERKQAKETAE